MRTYEVCDKGKANFIGKMGDNETLRLLFPMTKSWLESYPGCSVDLIHKRPKDEMKLPVSMFSINDDGVGEWIVTSADVKDYGYGELELIMTNMGKVEKSMDFTTQIIKSEDPGEDVPEPYEGWVIQILGKADEAREYAEKAKNFSLNAETMAERAEDYANDALSSKETSEAIQSSVESQVATAVESANTASDNANLAIYSADDAYESQLKAQEASVYASISASQASAFENTARQYSDSASTAMNTAVASANVALSVQQKYQQMSAEALSVPNGTPAEATYDYESNKMTFKIPVGIKGDPGEPGRDGTDATVTSESVKSALGYTPADEEDISEIKSDISNQGETLEDHESRIEELENAPAPVGGVQDVKANGESVVVDGVANIPVASNLVYGLVKTNPTYGLKPAANGFIQTNVATNSYIDSRTYQNTIISPTNLDYAVKQALCDGKGAEWTAEEQASARERLSVYGGVQELIREIVFTEDVNAVTISADNNGDPFALSYAFVVFTCPQNKIFNISNFGAASNVYSNSFIARAQVGTKTAPNVDAYCAFEIYQEKGYWYSRYSYTWQVNTTVNNLSTTSGLSYYNKFSVKNYPSIKKLFTVNTADVIPAGASITVYGVRA